MSRYSLRVGYHPDLFWRWEILIDGKPSWPRPHGGALTKRAALRRGNRRLRQVQKREARGKAYEASYQRYKWFGGAP